MKMSVYSEKPWLKNYKVGSFKLRTSMDYPVEPLYVILDDAAAAFPSREALYFQGNRMKYRALKELADRFACALHSMNLAKGDRVMVCLPTCPQFVISDFAILKNGAVLVPVSPDLPAPELRRQASLAGASGIICLKRQFEKMRPLLEEENLKWIITTSRMDYADHPPEDASAPPPALSFTELIATHPPEPPEVSLDPKEDLAILSFTGGSTGIPKGVMLTHFQRLANIHQGIPWMMAPLPTLRGTSSALIPIPVFHTFGHWVMQSAIFWAFRILLLPNPRNIRAIVKTMNEFRPFMAFLVPAQLLELGKPGRELKRMQTFVMSGAAPLPLAVAEKVEQIIKMPVSEGYGLSESGPCTHINLTAFAKITRLSSHTVRGIGMPVPDTEAAIVDPETEKPVPPGEVGEIRVRGPQIMKGYWPEPGSGLTEDGWLKTGDLGRMDGEGYFSVVDRIKDMINVGGMKVYSRDLDEIIIRHEGVENVVTVGVPDPRIPGSERIRVFIIPKPEFKDTLTADQIVDYCTGKVSPYALPHEVVFRDELPHTVTEKLFKRALREEG